MKKENHSSHLPSIICLMGPTASGKTQLAIEIVRRFPCEIISVDSRMVYRGMDIGTAKPDLPTQKIAPHRLIDLIDPKDTYSAGKFREDALCEIENIISFGRIPLLVGGTMLYFRILNQGLAKLPSTNETVRATLKKELNDRGLQALYKRLTHVDLPSAKRIHQNDSQRILRALEIYEQTNKTMTAWLSEGTLPLSSYHVNNLILNPNREYLHSRIQMRLDQMLAVGFIDEVIQLHNRTDLSREMAAFRSVGYQEVWDYLEGHLDYQTMYDKIIIATRQLAKRQVTWLRSGPKAMQISSEFETKLDEVFKWVDTIVA